MLWILVLKMPRSSNQAYADVATPMWIATKMKRPIVSISVHTIPSKFVQANADVELLTLTVTVIKSPTVTMRVLS
jgi:hypothetical protein